MAVRKKRTIVNKKSARVKGTRISRVVCENKKREFVVEAKGNKWIFPYSELSIKPSASDPVISVSKDFELGSQGFNYVLASGKTDTVLLEQVMAYNQAPEYLIDELLYRLTLAAINTLRKKDLTKRQLARRLNTSPAQIQRLFDPTYYRKTIDQMVRLLRVLGYEVDIILKSAA